LWIEKDPIVKQICQITKSKVQASTQPQQQAPLPRERLSPSAQNDRPKTRPAVWIVFRYRLRLRKGRSLKNTNTLKVLYFLNAPF
jgi:hypothetical protein